MVIVLGFGRSGTTWISDILSRAIGGLILFEPLHPSVYLEKRNLAYLNLDPNNIESISDSLSLETHLKKCINKEIRESWLLRNHLHRDLVKEDIDPSFFELVFDNSRVLGFKSIRLNFTIKWLKRIYPNSHIIYCIRNPVAVFSSIIKRNFWEFGWPKTYNIWKIQAKKALLRTYPEFISTLDNDKYINSVTERITKMWVVTNIVALKDIKNMDNTYVIPYEEVYENPYKEIGNLLEKLDVSRKYIHPNYIFSPSVTTAKTLHGLKNKDFRKIFTNIYPEDKEIISKTLKSFEFEYKFGEEKNEDCLIG